MCGYHGMEKYHVQARSLDTTNTGDMMASASSTFGRRRLPPPLPLLLLLLLLLLPHSWAFTLLPASSSPRPVRRAGRRPLWADLAQVEVRQATRADFGAIARARNTVLFVPEGATDTGSFVLGTRQFPVRNEEERLILSRVPYLVAGQAVAFVVEGRAGAGKVLAATVDVFVRDAEGSELPRRVFIKNMIVDSAFRRQGHARRLLARVEGYAGEVGAEEVHLEVLCDNEAALALYESEGFEFLREPFNLLARALRIGKATMRKRVGVEAARAT